MITLLRKKKKKKEHLYITEAFEQFYSVQGTRLKHPVHLLRKQMLV